MTMDVQNGDNRIEILRNRLRNNPKDARSMALLANSLMERVKFLSKLDEDDTNIDLNIRCCDTAINTHSSNKVQKKTTPTSKIITRRKLDSVYSWREEAISLSRQSITLAPDQSIGYASLSVSSQDSQERISSLRKAVDLEQRVAQDADVSNKLPSYVAIVTSLVRLLIEPREEEAVTMKNCALMRETSRADAKPIVTVGRTSPKHPLRRDLNENEQKLYRNIVIALERAMHLIRSRREEKIKQNQKDVLDSQSNKIDEFNGDDNLGKSWNLTGECKTSPSHEGVDNHCKGDSRLVKSLTIPSRLQYLAKSQYRLGTLFRVMMPHSVHRKSSRYHFKSVLEILIPPANENYRRPHYLKQRQCHSLVIKSRFWLATFLQDEWPNGPNGDEDDVSAVTERSSAGSTISFPPKYEDIGIDRCPSEYVVSLYSSFAANFDHLLVNKLKYETPTKLRILVDQVLKISNFTNTSVDSSAAIVPKMKYGADLGCGTGLSGIAFRDLVRHFSGVDLSPAMIAKAQARGCYDKLSVGDVESILVASARKNVVSNQSETCGDAEASIDVGNNVSCNISKQAMVTYDLITACDVFVYIGNLRTIFQSVADCLTPNEGLFAFSTELLDEEFKVSEQKNHDSNSQQRDPHHENCPFILQPCARFAHKRSYIKQLAEDTGFIVRALEIDVIRKNGGKDVCGILAVLSTS